MEKFRRHTHPQRPSHQTSKDGEDIGTEEAEVVENLEKLTFRDVKVMSSPVEEKVFKDYQANSYYSLHILLR